MATKQEHEMIAKVLGRSIDLDDRIFARLCVRFAHALEEDNPRFKKDLFYFAADGVRKECKDRERADRQATLAKTPKKVRVS